MRGSFCLGNEVANRQRNYTKNKKSGSQEPLFFMLLRGYSPSQSSTLALISP